MNSSLLTIEWRPNPADRKQRGWPAAVWIRHSTYGTSALRDAALATLSAEGRAQFRATDVPLITREYIERVRGELGELDEREFIVFDSISPLSQKPVKQPTWAEYNARMEGLKALVRDWQKGESHG